MPNTLANLARQSSTTTGTGTLTLGPVVQGFNTFAAAGLTDGQTITYAIEDYSADIPAQVVGREIGQGVYSAGTVTRTTVYSSTNGGAKINCTGRQHVFITAAAEDLASFATDLTAHLNDTSDAHDASAISFTPAGNVAATDVQAAIAELDSEKLSTSAAASTYQPLDGDLTALAALSGTNTIYYRSAADTWSAVTVSASLGFSAGTLGGSLASNYQPLDSELTAIAGLTSAADRLPYFTGSGTASLATFTTAGRNLVDDADASAQRTTLGLGTAATQNTGTSGANVPLLSASNTFGAGQTISGSGSFFTALTAQSTNADANAGPYVILNRSGGSPAASDLLGSFTWQGQNDALTTRNYAALSVALLDPTAGSDDSEFRVSTVAGGATSSGFRCAGGLYIGLPTGGDKGGGTMNATVIYENGTSLASKYGALASANVWTAAQTVRIDSAATNTVTVGATLSSTSTGTPAAGIGVSLAFEAETAAANNEVGATIEAVTTDVTSTSEDFDLVFKTMAAGATAAERMRVKSTGTVLHGTAALATNATDGFVYVPTCAGTPTGAPTAFTGQAAIVVDSTNNKLYFYSGGAWRDSIGAA